MEDNLLISLEDVNTDLQEFFELKKVDTITRTEYNSRLTIDFAMDMNKTIIERSVYNSFMLLGDVGGFTGFVGYIASVLVSIFTFQKPMNYLTKKLYVDSNGDQLDDKD